MDQAYPVATRLNTLLRHGDLPREEDGAIEFWRLKDYLPNDLEGRSKDNQRIQPKSKTQLSGTGRPVCGQESTKEVEKRTTFDHDTLSQAQRVRGDPYVDQNPQSVAC